MFGLLSTVPFYMLNMTTDALKHVRRLVQTCTGYLYEFGLLSTVAFCMLNMTADGLKTYTV
jgi:hypothetical protein